MRCPNCRVEAAPGEFCAHCGAQLPAAAPQKEPPPTIEQLFEQARAKQAIREMGAPERAGDPLDAFEPHNNSGTVGDAPQEVLDMGYCWPAFLFPGFWRMAHHIPSGFDMLIGLLGQMQLGSDGYKLAWQHRRFDSMAQFKQTMAAWVTAAKIVPLVGLGGLILHLLREYLGYLGHG